MSKLSVAKEQYIENIFELSPKNHGVRITDISKKMDVSKACVTNTVQELTELGYLTNEKYQLVFLTKKGLTYAKTIDARHQIIKDFFVNVLKVDEELADSDACLIEHIINPSIVDKMKLYLEDEKPD